MYLCWGGFESWRLLQLTEQQSLSFSGAYTNYIQRGASLPTPPPATNTHAFPLPSLLIDLCVHSSRSIAPRLGVDGSIQSFLLRLLKDNLRGVQDNTTPGLGVTCCCCLLGLGNMISHSLLFIVLRVALNAVKTWLCALRYACDQGNAVVDIESARTKGRSTSRSFIFVDFNAWEYAGSEVLWAALITKIFDAVSKIPLTLSLPRHQGLG